MEAKLISNENNEAKLELDDMPVSLVNALRRFIINSVETLAIEDVTVYKNSSTMYDEILASRLGLIPLKTPVNSKKKTFNFKLKAIGPKNVYASDLVPEDPEVKPVYDKMLIIKLKDGESIDLEATAVFGSGQDHAKFTPAHVFHHFYPIIKITNKEVKEASKIASLCPRDVLEGEDGKLSVKKGKLQDCILCMACQDYAGEDIFEIESWGQLTIKEIFEQAFSKMEEELGQIEKSI